MSVRVFVTDPARPFVCPEGARHCTSALIGDDRIFWIDAPDDFLDVTDELVRALIGLEEAGVAAAYSEDPDERGPGVDLISQDDPIVPVTFGQGSFGHRCRFCLADDYATETVIHKQTCLWVWEQRQGRPTS